MYFLLGLIPTKDYPESVYRQDSEMMIFQIHNVTIKDNTIAAHQSQIETFQQELGSKGNEIITLQRKIEALEQEVKTKEHEIITLQTEILILQKGTADKVQIEKKERRLTLLSNGKVLKTYKIALGGNPVGPKESKVITKPRREPPSSIRETGTASITYLFIFPIQTKKTKSGQKNWVYHRAETS